MTVELKNDLAITGVLVSVDQFLNIKLDNIKVVDEERYPHMVSVTSIHTSIHTSKGKRAVAGGRDEGLKQRSPRECHQGTDWFSSAEHETAACLE